MDATYPEGVVKQCEPGNCSSSKPARPKKSKLLLHETPSYKRLVQRRIHISDVCRVCEETATEAASRCDLKCVTCGVTVHRSCYDADPSPDTDWRCRPCSCEAENLPLPTHQAPTSTNPFHVLQSCADFAIVYTFLVRFANQGLRIPSELTLQALAQGLTFPDDDVFIERLHTRLLSSIGKSISKNHHWSYTLERFLGSSSKKRTTGEDCGMTSSQDGLQYHSLKPNERARMLKSLCDAQFDHNDALVEQIGNIYEDDLRDLAIGTDARGRSYWLLDDPDNSEFWLCRCDGHDGSQWETVCSDPESLESMIEALSHSRDTCDLQLWRSLYFDFYPALMKRIKKKKLADQRLARMPRLLGASGPLEPSMNPFDSMRLGAHGAVHSVGGRSLRARRAVSYYGLVAPDSDDDDAKQACSEEDEVADSEGGSELSSDSDGNIKYKKHSVTSARSTTRALRNRSGGLNVTQPTRFSRRLRGVRAEEAPKLNPNYGELDSDGSQPSIESIGSQ